MAVLRLPNPGSDLDRFVSTFALIAKEAGNNSFDLDFMSLAMTKHFQASSMGAHGEEAVRLSTRIDRSRDPLFNQSKMYSELYRMLGWIRSKSDSHSVFNLTPLGETIMHYQLSGGPEIKGLVGESFISAVFPNPSTTNIGIINHRPFMQLLKLAYFLGGEITRDEMIIGVLSVTNDLVPGIFETKAAHIMGLRKKGKDASKKEVEAIAKQNKLQVNTLENYTRLPVAVMSSKYLSWGEGVFSDTTYKGKDSVKIVRLTELGITKAKLLIESKDLRFESISENSIDERTSLAHYGYYAMAIRSGIKDQEIFDLVEICRDKAHNLISKLDISDPELLIFNPSLQESQEVLDRAIETSP